MFIDIRNLQERREERDSQFETSRDIRNGYLFEVNGSVEGDRSGLVWFKALDGNSEPFQVFYNGIIGDLRANMFVKIERKPRDPSRWQVIEFDTGIYFDDQASYEQLPSLSQIPLKADYEWPPGYPGSKALNIFPRAVVDFAVRPTTPASMKARVYSGYYPGATNYEQFSGPVNTKDFTASIPGAGLAMLVAITIDSSGTLGYTDGTTFVDGLPMPPAALPDVPITSLLISAVRLTNGMTAINESNFDMEMRPLMGNGSVNVKVSEVWESDFGAVALEADATGQIGINQSTPTELLHISEGDILLDRGSVVTADTRTLTLGGARTLAAANYAKIDFQNYDGADYIGARIASQNDGGASDGDLRFSTYDGSLTEQVIITSSGTVGVGVATITAKLHVGGSTSAGSGIKSAPTLTDGTASMIGVEVAPVTVQTNSSGAFYGLNVTPSYQGTTGTQSAFYGMVMTPTVVASNTITDVYGAFYRIDHWGGTVTNAYATKVNNPAGAAAITNNYGLHIASLTRGTNNWAIYVAGANRSHFGGDVEFAEMTAPGAGAANTARLYAVDNGAGKTQLAVVFNTGAVQILATQP